MVKRLVQCGQELQYYRLSVWTDVYMPGPMWSRVTVLSSICVDRWLQAWSNVVKSYSIIVYLCGQMFTRLVQCGKKLQCYRLSVWTDGYTPGPMWSRVPVLSSICVDRWLHAWSNVVKSSSIIVYLCGQMVTRLVQCGQELQYYRLSVWTDGYKPGPMWSRVTVLSSICVDRWLHAWSNVVKSYSIIVYLCGQMVTSLVKCGQELQYYRLSVWTDGYKPGQMWSRVTVLSSICVDRWLHAWSNVVKSYSIIVYLCGQMVTSLVKCGQELQYYRLSVWTDGYTPGQMWSRVTVLSSICVDRWLHAWSNVVKSYSIIVYLCGQMVTSLVKCGQELQYYCLSVWTDGYKPGQMWSRVTVLSSICVDRWLHAWSNVVKSYSIIVYLCGQTVTRLVQCGQEFQYYRLSVWTDGYKPGPMWSRVTQYYRLSVWTDGYTPGPMWSRVTVLSSICVDRWLQAWSNVVKSYSIIVYLCGQMVTSLVQCGQELHSIFLYLCGQMVTRLVQCGQELHSIIVYLCGQMVTRLVQCGQELQYYRLSVWTDGYKPGPMWSRVTVLSSICVDRWLQAWSNVVKSYTVFSSICVDRWLHAWSNVVKSYTVLSSNCVDRWLPGKACCTLQSALPFCSLALKYPIFFTFRSKFRTIFAFNDWSDFP